MVIVGDHHHHDHHHDVHDHDHRDAVSVVCVNVWGRVWGVVLVIMVMSVCVCLE